MPRKRSVTIRDVARKAGVSPGTASRAINNSPLVNEATRGRVLEAVDELNYTPNLVARRLSIGKTLVVAVVVPFFTRPGFSERISGIVSVLAQTEYDLVIHNIETPEQRNDCFRVIPRRERADGALFLSLPPRDDETGYLANANVPIVLIDSDHPALTTLHRVTVDDVAGGQAATQYLIELGHTRIGFVGDIQNSPFNFVSSRNRYLGYQKALEAAGIPVRPEYYGQDQHGRPEARQTANRMLTLPDRPTAIFAASDTQAVGVLEAARDAGLRVPRDLSVVGYDDIEIADIMGLTTMRQMLFESGQQGVELLLETLENPQMEPVHDVLPSELIVRGTTAPPSN